jgi:hypothetical protein
MQFVTFFNLANAHLALKTMPAGDTHMAYFRGTALGSPAACLVAKQISYDPTRGNDGSLTAKVEGQGNAYGLEWGEQLTAGLRTDTAATNGTTVDDTAGTSFGAQAYLQVTAFTGTDVTVKVQHSTDGSTWTDLVAFTPTTAAHIGQRATVSNSTSVNRYVRAATVTTGGFTSVTFAVAFMRNPIAGVRF